MVFNLFKKKKKTLSGLDRTGLDIPPVSMTEEDIDLPTFPSSEDIEMPKSRTSEIGAMETEAIKDVESQLGEREDLELKKPIFVEAKLYKGVMDDVGVLKTVLKDSTDRLQTISDLKDSREKNYGVWHKQIEDIQRKLIYTDNVLFGKKR